MSKKSKNNLGKGISGLWHRASDRFKKFWHRGFWQKTFITLITIIVFLIGSMWGIAQWYIYQGRHQPVQLGATFISGYAQSFGLDPKQTLNAVFTDLNLHNVRLVSYWDEHEKIQGEYDFSDLDWQFQMAEKYHAKVSLAIGLRQPRWPECHIPDWAALQPKDVWAQELKTYMGKVIDRYKFSPALDSYQLENEYFLTVFGICPDFSRDRLVDEYNLVKDRDPMHTLVVSMSNNAIGSPIGEPTPDEYAISIYKRVWDKTITKRYFEYPIPAWYYAFRAGFTKITTGKDSFVHELQAEAWLPDGYTMKDASIDEMYKSMNPQRLSSRIYYGQATGMKKVDLWGVEWWYYMKEKRGAPELWQSAKDTISKIQGEEPTTY